MTVLKTTDQLRMVRRRTPTRRIPVTVAALWPKKGTNLGTMLRTVDAVGAHLVIPSTAEARKALRHGNTIGMHDTLWDTTDLDPIEWLTQYKGHKVAVELAWVSKPIADLAPWTGPTALVLGHESLGVPDAALALCDEVVEIPMSGVGNSLNVAVAGSLALYKLAGLI